ncbi:MAG: glycosyltransferase family 2 protein [Alphaproteobacteria bacterium]|nr:glycosyltransferase family 2 protein [Alphaproteobacteria bacterium]
MIETFIIALAWFIIGAGLLQNLIYAVQLFVAGRALALRPPLATSNKLWQRTGDVVPPISVLVPAYNEERTIVAAIRSMLSLEYPNFEVIVIDDGSSDNTLAAIDAEFQLKTVTRAIDKAVQHKPLKGVYASERTPKLIVVAKENGGKADALNAGINVSRAPLFCALDADSLLEGDALLRAVQPFVDDPIRTVAVGGTIRILNGCTTDSGRVTAVGLPKSPLALFQIIEYLRAFLMARLSLSRMQALTIISGAFGLFRRQVAISVGGYSPEIVGEDLELVIKIHRAMRERGKDYRVEFIPEPVCWTEAPESLGVLANQRRRWQRGALETFFKHKDMLTDRRYGRISWLGMGQMLLVDVIGPIVEVLGYILIPFFYFTGQLSIDYMLAFLAVTFAFGVFISVGALILEELELRRFPNARDLSILALAAVAENFGYRQLNNLWRLQGLWQYMRGESGWGPRTVRA